LSENREYKKGKTSPSTSRANGREQKMEKYIKEGKEHKEE